jgi:hypothetical protein
MGFVGRWGKIASSAGTISFSSGEVCSMLAGGAGFMATINDVQEQRGALLKGGTKVDRTIVHASPSTKNRTKSRAPEMHQTKKGNQCYSGMKVHVGADVNSAAAHIVSVTSANTA